MKPQVDKEKCIGCGTCVSLCPTVFAIGDDGKSDVINQASCETGECDCQAAVDSCPSQAISLK
ncbi:MAG: ferredoxin [Patescibacteria group bacterium]